MSRKSGGVMIHERLKKRRDIVQPSHRRPSYFVMRNPSNRQPADLWCKTPCMRWEIRDRQYEDSQGKAVGRSKAHPRFLTKLYMHCVNLSSVWKCWKGDSYVVINPEWLQESHHRAPCVALVSQGLGLAMAAEFGKAKTFHCPPHDAFIPEFTHLLSSRTSI